MYGYVRARQQHARCCVLLFYSVLALLVQVSVGYVLRPQWTPYSSSAPHQTTTTTTMTPGTRTTTPTVSSTADRRRRRTPATQSLLVLHAIDVASVDQARTAFFIWFFGGSGGVGIASSAFPRMYRSFQATRQLKGVPAAAAAAGRATVEMIGISPLCGYPQDVPVKDVLQIVQKSNVDQIVKRYPIEGNFLSQQGYLTYAAFQQAHSGKCNPLAIRVVFDALNKGSDVCIPNLAQDTINELIVNPQALAIKVLQAKAVGYGAICTLLFLLAVAGYETFVVHFRMGWFPEWPGLDNLPSSLFDPVTGLTAIPQYWLGDYK